MIQIKSSPTADTRTCDVSTVTKDTLIESSKQHINDVDHGLGFFVQMIIKAAEKHDADKLTDIDRFYADFQTGFKVTEWWENHKKISRHHLGKPEGVPSDVNLVDVLEMIVDCVMAGMARSGSVYPLEISDELLQRAFGNTVELLKQNVEVAR